MGEKLIFGRFLLIFVRKCVKIPDSSLPLSLWGAPDIAENRTSLYQQIHAKNHHLPGKGKF
jgi:hypothetical protein